jgi:hypothetical protein
VCVCVCVCESPVVNTSESCFGNVCGRRVQNSMTSRMLSKNLKFKFPLKEFEYNFANLKHGFGTWSLIVREERML